ncbi:MAG: mechanosensitive ion channel family protein [Candidatus Dormibacteria bacterium]
MGDVSLDDVLRSLGHAVLALPILVVTVLAAHLLRRLTRRATESARWDPQLTLLVGRLVYIGIVVTGVLLYIRAISATIAALLVTGVGLLGLAFGLAFQDVLKNFLSGIFLLLERPFRIGDDITIGVYSGRVETIRLRVTVLKSADGQMVLLPNQQVYTSAIVNATGYATRQFMSVLRLPGGRGLEAVLGKARTVLAGVDGVEADPPPTVAAVPNLEFGATLEARYWVDHRTHSPVAVQREVNAQLLHLVGAGKLLTAGPADDQVKVARKKAPGRG